MVALFKDRSPATIFWLFILSIVVHSHFFVDYPVVYTKEGDGLLSTFLKNYISVLSPAIVVFIYHGIVLLQALRLNFLFTGQRMYTKVNYLPAMVYILLTGVFTEWSSLSPALINNFLVIWLFAKAIHLYNASEPKTLIFNIGLLVGSSILLYHPSAMLFLFALFAVMVLRPFIITEWLVLLMAAICPYYFLAAYLYLTDSFGSIRFYLPHWGLNVPVVHVSVTFFVTIGVLIAILLTGLFYSQHENRKLVIQIRKNWTVLLSMVFILLPLPFINEHAGIESLLLWIVPVSPFIARGFLAPKTNTLPGLMFWALLALAILKNWQIVK